MDKKDKLLLLRDLCARMPYKVKCQVSYIINNETTDGENIPAQCIDTITQININLEMVYTSWLGDWTSIENIKPYLRPMDSMTEDELIEYDKHRCLLEGIGSVDSLETFDWLLANQFDFRDFISKGLALKWFPNIYVPE